MSPRGRNPKVVSLVPWKGLSTFETAEKFIRHSSISVRLSYLLFEGHSGKLQEVFGLPVKVQEVVGHAVNLTGSQI